MPPQDGTVVMEDVRLIFRNFSGKETKYNAPGSRNFAVLLPPDLAETLAEDGWNVKWLDPRDESEDEEKQPYLQVTVKYTTKARPPRVVMITDRGRTNLSEESIELLDWADIKTVDLIIRPYPWEVGGKSGIAAYCQSLYVTIEEDELEKKYAELDAQTAEG